MSGRRFHVLTLLWVLLSFVAAPAATDYYALLIRSLEPLDHVLLEKVKLNGKDLLHRLPPPPPAGAAASATLTRRQYEKAPQAAFAEVVSFKVAGGRLEVRPRTGAAFSAVPGNYKWPGASADPGRVIRNSTLSGRAVSNRQPFTAALQDGWIVYLFAARPPEDTIAFAVAEAQNQQAVWENFLQRFSSSSHVAAAREYLARIYLGQAREALARFRAALERRTPGYPALGEARQWLERLRTLNVSLAGFTDAEAEWNALQTSLTDRLRQARLLAENTDFPGAQKTLEPLLHFRDEFPELAAEGETIRRMAAQHHLAQARQRLARNQFDEAVRELDAAASFLPLDEIANVRKEIEVARTTYLRQQEIRQTLERVRQAAAQKDYPAAFDLLLEASLRYPEDAPLRQELNSLQTVYRNVLLAEVGPVEKLHTPIRGSADEEILLRLHSRLARLTQVDSTTELGVWRDRLSTHLADYYRQRATKLANPNPQTPLSPLAFAYLQQAHHFALNKADLSDVVPWRERLENQLRIRVALNFRDLTPEGGSQYLTAELSARISDAMQRSGLPHVRVLEASRGETATPVLELIVELLHASVRDDAQTEPLQSEYSAGFRQVPNPQWRDAKVAYDRAVEEFEKMRSRVEQNRRSKKKQSDKERRADNEALARAEAALKQAKDALDALPAFVEQEDIKPYEFNRRAVTRTAQMRLTYRWVNVPTGAREVQQILEEKEPATEIEITGVNPGDKRGHGNQLPNLPDAETMRGRVLAKIQEKLTEQAINYLKGYIGRDFERARQKVSRGELEGAAEDYLRFLFNSPADDPRRNEAIEFLRREFRLVTLGDWLAVPRERT